MFFPPHSENFKGLCPWFTVGCREIAAASLRDGGMCLITGVCVRQGVTVWPSEKNMWQQQQVGDFAEKLVFLVFIAVVSECVFMCDT